MNKLKVGVLMGGKSREREVSLNSGRTICDHLDIFRYDIIPLFQAADGLLYILPWRFLHRGKTTDFVHKLSQEAECIAWDDLKSIVDFIYIAMHGRFGEDGTLQGLLEVLDIPYFGSKVFASALGMDKYLQKVFLIQAGIETPSDILVKSYDVLAQKVLTQEISYPCIVKPRYEGSSFGVSVVHNDQQLQSALEKACWVNPDKSQDVLIEPKIEGMEFSIILIVDKETGEFIPLPPTEVVYEKKSDFWDYDQKYMPGRSLKFTPARCFQEQILFIQQTCLNVVKALGITTIARIDGFLTKDNRVVIIDPNTFSGAAPSSFLFKQAAEINMSHTQLINHLIETELKHYNISNPIIEESAMKRTDKKIRIAVLMGGRSHEKEISLESGRNIFYKLSPHKYESIPIFVNKDLKLFKLNQRQLVCNATQEIEHTLEETGQIKWNDLPKLCDFVFIGLHGGEGENGSVQGTLEMLGLPYNGSGVLTSALCIDKFKTNQFLKQKGFEVPSGVLVCNDTWQEKVRNLNFPLIVKPHNDGCSVGVQKVNNVQECQAAIQSLFALGKTEVLIEEYVLGMELTVGVIGNNEHNIYVLPPSQAIANHGILSIEEKFLPGQGENQTPAPLPDQALGLVQQTVVDVYQSLECKGYARIDCFYQDKTISPTGIERVVILEINTLPGLTPATCIFHQAAEIGLKPMEFIDRIIELGLQKHGQKSLSRDTKEIDSCMNSINSV